MAAPGVASPDVSVIIVNWNSARLLRECLLSVRLAKDLRGLSYETIVVDNGSTDDSLEVVSEDADVVLINCLTNLGFAAACNRGASAALGRCLLFLNPDCRVCAGSVDVCWRFLAQDPSIGAVGVALTSDDRQVSRSCHQFPTLPNFLFRLSGLSAVSRRFPDGSMSDWAHDSDRRVDHVIGAFYMVRADEFRALGGFDERFFVYLEDLDLSLRYRRQGQHCMFIASPPSYHKGGGASERARATRLFYATRSRILYAFKHFTPFQAWLHCAATLLLEPVARLLQLVLQARFKDIGEMLRGFAMVYRDLPATLRVARRQ